MQPESREDIRKLFKTFGVQADSHIMEYLARHPEGAPLNIRIKMENIPDSPEEPPLHFVIEGKIRR